MICAGRDPYMNNPPAEGPSSRFSCSGDSRDSSLISFSRGPPPRLQESAPISVQSSSRLAYYGNRSGFNGKLGFLSPLDCDQPR